MKYSDGGCNIFVIDIELGFIDYRESMFREIGEEMSVLFCIMLSCLVREYIVVYIQSGEK